MSPKLLVLTFEEGLNFVEQFVSDNIGGALEVDIIKTPEQVSEDIMTLGTAIMKSELIEKSDLTMGQLCLMFFELALAILHRLYEESKPCPKTDLN